MIQLFTYKKDDGKMIIYSYGSPEILKLTYEKRVGLHKITWGTIFGACTYKTYKNNPVKIFLYKSNIIFIILEQISQK